MTKTQKTSIKSKHKHNKIIYKANITEQYTSKSAILFAVQNKMSVLWKLQRCKIYFGSTALLFFFSGNLKTDYKRENQEQDWIV